MNTETLHLLQIFTPFLATFGLAAGLLAPTFSVATAQSLQSCANVNPSAFAWIDILSSGKLLNLTQPEDTIQAVVLGFQSLFFRGRSMIPNRLLTSSLGK